MSRGVFITGTDTDAGKTFVATTLIRLLRSGGHTVRAFKPVCTGVTETNAADVEALATVTGQTHEAVCPQMFSQPLSPPSAARHDGTIVDWDAIHAAYHATCAAMDEDELLVVEGAGGWLCPVDEERTMADLAVEWRLPVLLVIGLKLGAINHALLTRESMQRRGVDVRCVFSEPRLVDPLVRDSTVRELVTRGVPVFAEVKHGEDSLKHFPDGRAMTAAEAVASFFGSS